MPSGCCTDRRRDRVPAERERQRLSIRPRRIDSRLAASKRTARRRLYERTQPGAWLLQHIPRRTYRGDVPTPGCPERDWVSHSGHSASGDFCPSLHRTDLHTPGTATRAVRGQSQQAVQQALEAMRQALPFPRLGSGSDNGSEFSNHHLDRDGLDRQMQCPRGRPDPNDANAPSEQNNWTPVRRLLGYRR